METGWRKLWPRFWSSLPTLSPTHWWVYNVTVPLICPLPPWGDTWPCLADGPGPAQVWSILRVIRHWDRASSTQVRDIKADPTSEWSAPTLGRLSASWMEGQGEVAWSTPLGDVDAMWGQDALHGARPDFLPPGEPRQLSLLHRH